MTPLPRRAPPSQRGRPGRCRSPRPPFGLAVLRLILWTLLLRTASRRPRPALFTQMTPPPGSDGGLLNAIFGSLVMTVVAIAHRHADRHPGRHLPRRIRPRQPARARRALHQRHPAVSAPSIIIGLFVYEIVVVPMGHFSAWAGAVALAIIVIPVVVRTTEDMLVLVPTSLREAAIALGRAAVEGDPHGDLPRRPCGHADRRPAGRRAHRRRDRAAALHRAQQPVLEHRHERADGQPAGRHLPVRAAAPMPTGSGWPGAARC